MSMMPSIDKTRMTLRMTLALRAKLRTKVRAANGSLTENDVALAALTRELAHVTPDAEDVEWAKEERIRNARMRKQGRNGRD